MQHYFNQKEIQINTEKGSVVALGKFDGFHQGHKLLLDEVLRLQQEGYTGIVFTFDILKNSIFDVEQLHSIITSEEKCMLAEQMEIDVLVEYPFDDTFASMEPEDFVTDILVKRLQARYVVVGSDYGFGKKKRGNVELLQKLAETYGYQVIVIEKKKIHDITVSSTYIRSLIREGKMEEAEAFLGRPYFLSGHVVHGRELGRTIQVPTANLLPIHGKLYPVSGVYASRIHLADGRICYGITNIGDNPTVNSDRRVTIETHIFDFDSDIYEQKLVVELLSFIRGERKFSDISELKAQMLADMEEAKQRMGYKKK